MRSFAALAGATLTIDSRPGDGTTVRRPLRRRRPAAGPADPRPRHAPTSTVAPER